MHLMLSPSLLLMRVYALPSLTVLMTKSKQPELQPVVAKSSYLPPPLPPSKVEKIPMEGVLLSPFSFRWYRIRYRYRMWKGPRMP
jgi:hypothetical protein